jgi:hypothetical protein
VSDAGVTASVAGSRPTPLREAVCVPALSVTLKAPFRVPDAVGWNATDTVHPTPAASAAPQVLNEIVKSPVTTGVCSAAVTPPVFEMVKFCAALTEPTLVPEYVTEIGLNTIAAAGAPTPLNAAVACPPATLP